MACKLFIADEAKNDIDSIVSHIVNVLKNPTAAKNLLTQIESVIDAISLNPLAFPLCLDKRLKAKGYRKVSVKNYIVFYRVNAEKNTVYILRVIYGRRNYINFL